jgi:hypothetical protein
MLALADATSPALTPLSSGSAIVVALLALVFAVLAFRAASKKGNASLRFVGTAFVLFALKDAFSAYNVVTHDVPHDAIELVLSLADLVIILLLFAPFAFRRRA